jgi:hypothetical protein
VLLEKNEYCHIAHPKSAKRRMKKLIMIYGKMNNLAQTIS